jgi:hypothetical protein
MKFRRESDSQPRVHALAHGNFIHGLVLWEAQKMAERPEGWLRQFAEFRAAVGTVWGALQRDLVLLDRTLEAERAPKKQRRKTRGMSHEPRNGRICG